MLLRSPATYFVLILVIGLQRLYEMRVSRRNCAALGEGARSPDPRGNWVAMVTLHVLLLLLPALEVAWMRRVAPAPLFWTSLVVLALAQGLRFWSLWTLGPMWNARGLIHPEQRIVSTGPYRYIKHPNYLAVLLEIFAIPLIGGAWRSLLLLLVPHLVVLRRRMRGEEELLRGTRTWTSEMSSKGSLYPRRSVGDAP